MFLKSGDHQNHYRKFKIYLCEFLPRFTESESLGMGARNMYILKLSADSNDLSYLEITVEQVFFKKLIN